MATIRDVAKLAGVGVGTASRALSGNGPVAGGTKQAVESAARKLDFRPSSTARSLSVGKSGLFGVLTPQFDGPYHSRAIAAAEREIRRGGRHMVVMSSRSDAYPDSGDGMGLASLIDRGVDAILHLSNGHDERDLILASERGPALALINRRIPALRDMCFSVDHYAAGRSVADYLEAEGHKSFATITGPLDIEDARARHQGFTDTLMAAGIALDPDLINHGGFDFASGRSAAEQLIATKKTFTALFCGNDEMAISAQASLHKAGIRPRIFGYDNAQLLDFADFRISSVEVPIEAMVENACRYLFNRCFGESFPVTREFPTRLILRH